MTDVAENGPYDFDVAVSFAAEDRTYVEEVVERLKAEGVRVFYDADYAYESWGEDLVEYFDQIYRVRSRYAVLFVSRFYADKMWTRHERRSALARGLDQANPYVLPVRLDDTSLGGLRPTVGYLDAGRVGIDGIVEATLAKLSGLGASPEVPIDRVPRTETERQLVLLQRPPGWEYLCFAGQLLLYRDSIEEKYRDHTIGLSRRTGEPINSDGVVGSLRIAIDDVRHLVGTFDRVMQQPIQERAFGARGEPGDPNLIVHLAKRWNGVYEGFIDWASEVRGLRVPAEFDTVVDLLARYADDPIHSYRGFVDELVSQVDRVPTATAAGEQVRIDMTMKLAIPEAVSNAFTQECKRIGTNL